MKKRNNNGFTLIELLAVIVILAIIALIAVPVIMNIINKANKSAFKDTAYGIVNAAELYFAEQQLEPNRMLEDVTILLPDERLQLKGEIPEGSIKITAEGKVAMAVSNGRYCITKGYEDTDINIFENTGDCLMPILSQLAISSDELEVKTVNECSNTGICGPGTPFAIRVNNDKTYKFYVLSDTGTEVTLIMDRNLGTRVAWIDKDDYADNDNYGTYGNNNKGPITALNELEKRTTEWINIPEKTYTYSGIAHDGITKMYEDITETMRARMLTFTEQAKLCCLSNDGVGCPDWLYTNLSNSNTTEVQSGYWTSTPCVNGDSAYIMFYPGVLWHQDTVIQNHGLRPVIELSK